jgi:hypothetical protein
MGGTPILISASTSHIATISFIIIFRLLVMTARYQCFFRYRSNEEGNSNSSMPGETNRPKKAKRSQEFIEKLLVLKVSVNLIVYGMMLVGLTLTYCRV